MIRYPFWVQKIRESLPSSQSQTLPFFQLHSLLFHRKEALQNVLVLDQQKSVDGGCYVTSCHVVSCCARGVRSLTSVVSRHVMLLTRAVDMCLSQAQIDCHRVTLVRVLASLLKSCSVMFGSGHVLSYDIMSCHVMSLTRVVDMSR